jgi:hypothetical protein
MSALLNHIRVAVYRALSDVVPISLQGHVLFPRCQLKEWADWDAPGTPVMVDRLQVFVMAASPTAPATFYSETAATGTVAI